MATAYTSLLGLALPVTGEISGTWGDTVNNAITSLLDSAVAGTTTLSTDADVTLTTTTGATNQARQAILLCSGARTAIRNITAPAQSKMYVVINNTTGGYGVVIRGAGPTTGVTVANGKTAVVVWNGSDFVEVAPATATTATNLAGGAAGSLPYQSGAGATTFLSIGTNNFVLTSNGTAPVWTTNTGTGNVVRATSPTIDAPTVTSSLTASGPIFTTGTISTHAANRLGLQYNEIYAWGANASTQGSLTFRLRSSDGSVGSNPVAITSAGMDITGALTASTSARSPIIIGGTGTTSTLALRSTSGVGTTGADIIFQTGNNGATEAMRILNSGNILFGTTATRTLDGANPRVFNEGTTDDSSTLGLVGNKNGLAGPYLMFGKSRGTTLGSNTIVQNGDYLGAIEFCGADGTDINTIGAYIRAEVDGTPGVNDMPGRLTFATTADGAAVSTERVRIDSSGNVGIGTNNPLIRLHVENAAGSYNSTADNGVALYLKSSSAAATNNFQGIQFAALSGNSNNSAFTIGISSPATGYSPDLIFSQRTGVSTWVERMHIDGSGNLGIGTSSPARILHVASANPTAFFDRDGGNPGAIGLRGSRGTLSAPTQSLANDTLGAVSGFGYTSASSFTSAGIANMTFYAAEALTSTAQGSYITFSTTSIGTATPSERMLISSAGNVGIGTSSPSMTLDVRGASTTSGASRRLVYISDTTTGFAAGVGGGIALAGIINTGGTVATFGGIQAQKESSTEGVQSGYLTLVTNNGSALVERMRIDSTGNVGIGTSSPSVALHVVGIVRATDAFAVRDSSNNLAGTFENDSTNLRINAEVSGKDMIFRTRTLGGSILERMRITADGNVGIGSASPVNKLDVVGSFGRGAPVTKTGNFNLAATENWLICNGAGTITVTLPAASSWTGREVMIKTIAAQTVVSASSNVVPLTGGAAGTAILAATAGKWATLVSDGTNWVIMSAA